MSNNVIENIVSIEMCPMVVDSTKSDNYIMIQTKRNKYCFKLSETVSIEKQYDMFRGFITDVSTPVEQPKVSAPTMEERLKEANDGLNQTLEKVLTPNTEKHDGAPLFDVPPSAPTDVVITTPHGCATQD